MSRSAQAVLLYRNLLQATDLLYPNPKINSFVKEEIRREYESTKDFKQPALVQKNLNRGYLVLSTMVALLEKKGFA